MGVILNTSHVVYACYRRLAQEAWACVNDVMSLLLPASQHTLFHVFVCDTITSRSHCDFTNVCLLMYSVRYC